MSSDGKDSKSGTPATQTSEKSLADELDLDKNPIKFATSEPGKFITDAHDKEYMEMTLRGGQHSDRVKKLLRQRIEMRAKEFPRWPADYYGGVRVMWIESRFWYDRERLLPDFDDDWRMYRAKYLHSLELDPREPVHVPEYERELINPIRRLYMRVGDVIENGIFRRFTNDKWASSAYRAGFTRIFMAYLGCMAGYYYLRYHSNMWTHRGGLKIFISQPIMYENHPKFPFQDFRTEPANHWDLGFSRREFYKDLRDFEDTKVL